VSAKRFGELKNVAGPVHFFLAGPKADCKRKRQNRAEIGAVLSLPLAT
jgi:hypothetical protein